MDVYRLKMVLLKERPEERRIMTPVDRNEINTAVFLLIYRQVCSKSTFESPENGRYFSHFVSASLRL